jgi:hypothetical protein
MAQKRRLCSPATIQRPTFGAIVTIESAPSAVVSGRSSWTPRSGEAPIKLSSATPPTTVRTCPRPEQNSCDQTGNGNAARFVQCSFCLSRACLVKPSRSSTRQLLAKTKRRFPHQLPAPPRTPLCASSGRRRVSGPG